MRQPKAQRRVGFTLIELVVVIAILVTLIGLLLAALQRIRETANQVQCANNMKELTLAVHNFQNVNGTMPPYFGIYPLGSGTNTQASNNPSVPYGGWFLHLMPYLEQDAIWAMVNHNTHQTGQNTGAVQYGGSGALVSPGTTAVYDFTGCLWIPPTYSFQPMTNYNGHTTYGYVQTGGGYWEPPPVLLLPGTPATYSPANSGPYYGPVGIWMDGVHEAIYKVLQCPSDPTMSASGLVGGYWGYTNYLANWDAWGDSKGDGSVVLGLGASNWTQNGYWSPPQPITNILDGTSNTILFGEGYSLCDTIGRSALYPADTNNFGITWDLVKGQMNGGTLPNQDFPGGIPNTFLFQVRPLPFAWAQCPDGADCCDNWRAQTGHQAMNAALADGSVRAIAGTISQQTWNYAMQPRDGNALGNDW
jgi:type II secretory pathway pseudopilin PulG